MSPTPFYAGSVPVAGGGRPRERSAPVAHGSWWMGRPGRLVRLPGGASGYDLSLSMGETTHYALSGLASVTRRATAVNGWGLSWQRLGGRDWQLLQAFWRRVAWIGPAPWCLLSPEDVNRLTDAVSATSGLNGAVEGWGVTGGVLSVDASQAPPLIPAGVLRWSGVANGDYLVAGSASPLLADPLSAAPTVAGLPVRLQAWMWCASGTVPVTWQISMRDAAGGNTGVSFTTAATLTTTPQLVSVIRPASGVVNEPLMLPALRVVADGASDVFVSAAQLAYSDQAFDWQLGAGVPRVIPDGAPQATVDGTYMRDVSWRLALAA